MIAQRKHLAAFLLSLLPAIAAACAGDMRGLPTATPESQGMSTEKLAEIEGRLKPFVEQHKLPGYITAAARNGKVVHFNAYGQMDAERGKPMRPDTIFRMYSMSKPVTGAAIMILIDEGKIAESDLLSKYIPEFAHTRVLRMNEDGTTELVAPERPITIAHLLTHTSGLTYIFIDNPVAKMYQASKVDSDGSSGFTLKEFASKVASMPLLVQPGTQFNYSISMDILGRVVEVVTGERYADFLRRRIFEPLGMRDFGFYVPADKAERLAANYGPGGANGTMRLVDDPVKSPFLRVPSQDSGGGGMVGTAGDYLRFAQMLLNGGQLDGVRILSEAAVRKMTSDHLASLGDSPVSILETIYPGHSRGVGFGYCGSVVRDGVHDASYGNAGEYSWGGAASTDFWIDPKQRLVGMVLTQFLPTGAYPTRSLTHAGINDAIKDSYK